MKITEEGKQKIQADIEQQEENLKNLREEKKAAYEMSGDTWHDNPYFNKLEADERAANARLSETKEMLRNAEIVDTVERNTEQVEIGSIVRCHCTYFEPTDPNQIDDEEEVTYEIVGHGETDIPAGKVHYESVVASNIIGLKPGDETRFATPGGDVTYRIIKLFPDWDAANAED